MSVVFRSSVPAGAFLAQFRAVGLLMTGAMASVVVYGVTPRRNDPVSLAHRIAAEEGVDPHLVCAVMRVESGLKADAVSRAGAMGLMQLTPGTARRFGVRNPFDPEQNVRGGVRYLRFLLQYFKGNGRLALAGYNAGEGAVIAHGGIPPFAETRAYVPLVIRHYQAEVKGRSPRRAAVSGPRTVYVWRGENGELRVSETPELGVSAPMTSIQLNQPFARGRAKTARK